MKFVFGSTLLRRVTGATPWCWKWRGHIT